jgi:hypothetical protein
MPGFRIAIVTLLALTTMSVPMLTSASLVGGEPASGAPEADVEPFLVGQLGGEARAIATDGRVAYVGHGTRVVLLDVTGAGRPQEIARSPALPGTVKQLAVGGQFLYVAHSRGLSIVDVTDPRAPLLRGFYPQIGGLKHVTLAGHSAYTLATGAALASDSVIDVADPDHPVGGGELGGAKPKDGLVIRGQTGYAVSGQFIQVFHMTTPAWPDLVFSIGFGENNRCIEEARGKAYVCSETNDIRIYDVSVDLDHIRLVGRIALPARPLDIVIRDDIAYVATAESLVILDLAQSPPQLRLELPIPAPRDLAIAGEWVYVTGASGVWAVPAAGPSPGQWVSRVDMLTVVDDVLVRGSLAYIAAWTQGVGVIDIARPDSPRLLALAAMDDQLATRLALDSDSLYAINENGRFFLTSGGYLGVYSISDPTGPVLRSTIAVPGHTYDVAAAAGYVYIAAGSAGLIVVDARDDSRPIVVAKVGVGWEAKNVAVLGGYVLVADVEAGLRVLDVAVPSAPRELAVLKYYTQYDTRGLAVAGTVAYVPGYQEPLDPFIEQVPEDVLAIELADPRSPRFLSSAGLFSGPIDVAVAGGRLVLADAPTFNRFEGPEMKLTVKGLAGRPGSGPLAMLDLPDLPTGVDLSADLAYVAAGDAGLLVIRVGDQDLFLPTATPTRRPTGPTPTRDPSQPSRTPGPATWTPFPTATLRATPPRKTEVVATVRATPNPTEPPSRLALPRVVR